MSVKVALSPNNNLFVQRKRSSSLCKNFGSCKIPREKQTLPIVNLGSKRILAPSSPKKSRWFKEISIKSIMASEALKKAKSIEYKGDVCADKGWADVLPFCNYFTSRAIRSATYNGHLEAVKWLIQNGKAHKLNVLDLAAHCGHLHIVKWLTLSNVLKFTWMTTTEAMNNAAGQGYLEMVKFLHENRKEGCTSEALDNAAKSGYLDMVKYLVEVVKCKSFNAVYLAIQYKQWEIVRYLTSRE